MGVYPLYSTWFSIFCNLISKIICFFPDTPLDKSGKIVIIYNIASQVIIKRGSHVEN